MNSSFTLSVIYQAQLQRLLAHQQAVEAELAKRNLQDLPIEKLFRLSHLISRQLQRLLKAAAPVPTQIKPDQASVVELRSQRAGEGGFQPPVPSQPASTQIKVNQASGKITAADGPGSEFKVQSSAFEVQGSPSQPESAPSTQIKPDQASVKCNDIAHPNGSAVTSQLSTLNPPLSTVGADGLP